MKNVSITEYGEEKNPSVSVNETGNMKVAERVLKELNKYPIDSHSIRVGTIMRPGGTKHVTFFLNMTFKKSSDAREAYKAAGGE